MVSKAIASLDAWLARAEQILGEQREHALSPSEGAIWNQSQERSTITLSTLASGLGALLESLCARPGRWILIVEEDRRRQRAWQALAYEDGSLVTEVISNRYLRGTDRWTTAQEAQLSALGWEPPDSDHRPNWISVEHTTSPDTEQAAQRGISTLREVFGLRDHERVFVKMFSSELRGDTPASAVYDQGSLDAIEAAGPTCEGSAGLDLDWEPVSA